MIEYLEVSFHKKYGASPAFFVGSLEGAVYAALHSDSIEDVRLVLYTDDECRLSFCVASATTDLFSP